MNKTQRAEEFYPKIFRSIRKEKRKSGLAINYVPNTLDLYDFGFSFSHFHRNAIDRAMFFVSAATERERMGI